MCIFMTIKHAQKIQLMPLGGDEIMLLMETGKQATEQNNVTITHDKTFQPFDILTASPELLETEITKFIKTRKLIDPPPHFFFLKTHKTASSTVQNILLRYGDYHDLKFAVPMGGLHRFAYPNRASSTAHIVPKNIQKSSDYNIVAHHMRFSEEILDYCVFQF